MRRMVFGVLTIFLPLVANFHILGIFPFPSHSHIIMFQRLMIRMAQLGHNVDVVSHFPLKSPVDRYVDLSLRGVSEIYINKITESVMVKHFQGRYNIAKFVMNQLGLDLCKTVFNTSIARELRNSKNKYDLVIAQLCGSDCFLSFGKKLNIPTINIVSSVILPWGNDRIKNPDNPSYIPVMFTPYTSKMSFIQRIDNVVTLLISKIVHSFTRIRSNSEIQKNFDESIPDLAILQNNTSFILVNSYFSFNQVRPVVANFKEVGGLHIAPTTNLTLKSLENALNITAAYKGVIYFSMGSMVLTETFPKELLVALFDAFRELPYKVLWKATKEKMPHDIDIPSNIYFESWIPQSDVLCHPNVKLFITHGGLLGTQEATYCGVPCLGIPLFADQELNLKALVEHGLALTLTYGSITKEIFLTTAQELLYNPSYKENAAIASRRFRDRPLSPLDTAVFWVEYVIRHNGARHLRSTGADLPWYQYHLLDVCAVLLLGTLISFYVIYRVIKILLAKLCISYSKQKQKVK